MMLRKASMLAFFTTFSLSIAYADEMHNHGYIGIPQFDITEKRFALTKEDGTCKYTFNDGHFHPKNFLMHGEPLSTIYEQTNKNCVDKILVNSLPLLEYWSEEARFALLITPMINRI
jgi:hypothetical protein